MSVANQEPSNWTLDIIQLNDSKEAKSQDYTSPIYDTENNIV